MGVLLDARDEAFPRLGGWPQASSPWRRLRSPAGLQRIPAWVAADLDFVDFHGQGDFDGDGNVEILVDLALGPEVFDFVRL